MTKMEKVITGFAIFVIIFGVMTIGWYFKNEIDEYNRIIVENEELIARVDELNNQIESAIEKVKEETQRLEELKNTMQIYELFGKDAAKEYYEIYAG